MHLTNYALNKNSENFIQPTDQDDGGGSKRSLEWFMQWIRTERGDAKADWLWRRIGMLSVRTVLSILPMLQREYDQLYKSFNNVPYNLTVSNEKNSRYVMSKFIC